MCKSGAFVITFLCVAAVISIHLKATTGSRSGVVLDRPAFFAEEILQNGSALAL
jgi:hypothetical protein